MRGLKYQSGFALLLELVLVLSIASSYAGYQLYVKERERSSTRAMEAGRQLQALSFSVMRYISEQGPATPVGNYTDVLFLKDASCGGTAAEDYLHCNFIDTNTFNSAYTTDITVSGTTVTAVVSIPWPFYMGETSSRLAGIIRLTAASFLPDTNQPAAQTFATYSLDTVNERVVATISTSTNNDIWLRTDGSNKMNADANLGGNDIYNLNTLYGGATATPSLADSVVVGSNLNVAGIITVNDSLGSGAANSAKIVIQSFDDNGVSLEASGHLLGENGDFTGTLTVGDGGGTSQIEFRDGAIGSAGNVKLIGLNSDLVLTNANGDATLVADKVYLKDINRYAEQGVFNVTMARHGDTIPHPPCPSGFTPQIFLGTTGLAGDGFGIAAFDVKAIPGIGSWTIDARMKTYGPGEVPSASISSDILTLVKCS